MTLTLKDLPMEVDEALRARAQAEGKDVAVVAAEAMRAGLGLPSGKKRDLSDLSGTWIEDPGFDAAMAQQDRVDWEMWK